MPSDKSLDRDNPYDSSFSNTTGTEGAAKELVSFGDQLFNPDRWAEEMAKSQIKGVSSGNFQRQNVALQPQLALLARRQAAPNPYSATSADQSRAAQLALLKQIEAQRAGPSLAAMQGGSARGRVTQQALAQGGNAGMLNARAASTGMAEDIARARAAEQLRFQMGQGVGAASLREQDIRSARQQADAGAASQQLSDEMSRFYGTQGAALSQSARSAGLEDYKLRQRLLQANQQKAEKTQAQTGDVLGTILSFFGLGV